LEDQVCKPASVPLGWCKERRDWDTGFCEKSWWYSWA